MATQKKTTVVVIATQDSRMRIGRQFGREPQVVEVTDDELERLNADPMLVVAAGEPAKESKPVK